MFMRGLIFPRGSSLVTYATAAALLLLPAAAKANSCAPGTVCFSNQGGTMTGSPTTGFFLNGSDSSVVSALTQIDGNSTTGTLSFTLGSLMSGSLSKMKAGQSLYFNPGTLTITGTFAGFTGVLFSGTFGDPGVGVQWTLDDIIGKGKNATYVYTLSGPVSGTWFTGLTVSGETSQLLFKSKGAYTGGSIQLENGSTFVVVPEPSTVTLLATALLGMGLVVGAKVRHDVPLRPI
jgi:hypothetical protein